MYRNPPTWHLYPVDIPIDRRARCDIADCDSPGDVIEVRANMRGEIAPTESAATIYCHGHGRLAGFEQPSRVLPPEHLDVFHRAIRTTGERSDALPQQR